MTTVATCIVERPPTMATFGPSLWGDTFSAFSLDDKVQETYAQAIEELKKEVRENQMVATNSGQQIIILIDAIERLGLAYHFAKEIEEKIKQFHDQFYKNYAENEEDLVTIALGFRLLREHHYHVSSGVFAKFMNKDKKFEETLIDDVEGLLNLYEAAHIRTHGEDILEEAVAFTTHHLNRVLPQLESPIKDKVKRALEHPVHKAVLIIEARLYISIYEKDESRDEVLLKLAKLNFNYLQNLYKDELSQLSRWWSKLDLKSKLVPYARDRLIECFFWGVAFQYEPEYSEVRIAFAKSMQMVSTIDDTYDNYATLEEAQLFSEILERWNKDEIGQLPDFMKNIYQFIMSVYEDYESDATKHGKSFAIPHFRESVKQLAWAYNKELKWIVKRELPSFEEYYENSVTTSCVYVMFTAHFPGMKSVTKETVDWLLSEPKIVITTAKTGRYYDDLGTHEREHKGGEKLTVMDCYMKEHGVSRQEAVSKFFELVEEGWKDLNTEWITKTYTVPEEMLVQLLNYVRVAKVTYNNGQDGYTNPQKVLGPYILALFVDPVVV
ncbi:cis-muuroladiene synthase [Handroanthus impetiginosus]|uniref:Cis-muuroladiene synthase n=1 Tax=Handroanthus impetiginosus TaxID=429701 RepID=A0A2G9HYQ4_9LAMI|nr:cis-muuroladiene synthase [Handroanthus impetiginosus]